MKKEEIVKQTIGEVVKLLWDFYKQNLKDKTMCGDFKDGYLMGISDSIGEITDNNSFYQDKL